MGKRSSKSGFEHGREDWNLGKEKKRQREQEEAISANYEGNEVKLAQGW